MLSVPLVKGDLPPEKELALPFLSLDEDSTHSSSEEGKSEEKPKLEEKKELPKKHDDYFNKSVEKGLAQFLNLEELG